MLCGHILFYPLILFGSQELILFSIYISIDKHGRLQGSQSSDVRLKLYDLIVIDFFFCALLIHVKIKV